MFSQQDGYTIRLEWGLNGLNALKPVTDVFVIVDVLSFSSCVDIAVSRGAVVYPYRYKDASAQELANSLAAHCAIPRSHEGKYSLSPQSLLNIESGSRLVLPSPNGAQLTLETDNAITLAGCLRNARAVANAAQLLGTNISVIACGERWSDNTIRFALEDYLGAGAIINALQGAKSPEAILAQLAFTSAGAELTTLISTCASGVELRNLGFEKDVELATEINTSQTVPILNEGKYQEMHR